MKLLLLMLLLLPLFAVGQTPQLNALLQEAKTLDQNAHEEEALQKYLAVLKIDPVNYEATWNTSFLYAKIGNRKPDNTSKKEYFNAAKQYAQKALLVKSTDAEANYVMAVAMGRMALISAPKEKVAASRDIRKYAELAIQYNPNHSGAWHILGVWNYEVANLNFAERSAAKYLFGGIPEGTVDNAIKNYLQAIKLDPRFILYYLDLARALHAKGYKEETIKTLKRALTLQPKTEDDPDYLKKCKMMLGQIQ